MKVLLIHPEIRTLEPPSHGPYGLMQLASIVDAMGYKCALLDNNAYRLPIDALRQEIKGDVQPKTIRVGMNPSAPMFGQMIGAKIGGPDVLEITITPDGKVSMENERFLNALQLGAISAASVEALRAEVKNFNLSVAEGWDVIGIGGLTTQFKFIGDIARICKEEFPAAVLVAGGGFATAQSREVMKWIPEFDIACIGEGVVTFRDVLEHLDDQNWKHVKGLAYRAGSKVKLSTMRPLIEEYYHCEENCNSKHMTLVEAINAEYSCKCGAMLVNSIDEEIPQPDYKFGAVETYLMNSRIPYSMESMHPNCRRLDVVSSYGCPWKCSFCFHLGSTPHCQSKIYGKTVTGKPYRQHSPQFVVDFIGHLRLMYNINFVSFVDENFTVNNAWFHEFCRRFEESELSTIIHWGILSHVKTVNKQLLDAGRNAGLSYVSYGGETSVQRLLDECGKGQTKEDLENTIALTQAANINAIMTFILGLPGMTIDDAIADCQFFIDNQIHTIPFFDTPYPATGQFEKYKDRIIEQHVSEEERLFLASPTPMNFGLLKFVNKEKVPKHCSQSWVNKNLPSLKEQIKESAFKRWVFSLDDATKLSANLTDFNDVELAGIQYMLAHWEIERLKKFKKLKEHAVYQYKWNEEYSIDNQK